MKAGGAYVPIDPDYPVERIGYMLESVGAKMLLSSGSCRDKLQGPGQWELIALDDEWQLISREPEQRVVTDRSPDQLAYVIYTSGSTGRPKGVMVEQQGLVNRLLWAQDYFRLTASDAVLQKTTYCFDVSVWELLWPLLTGARLVFAGAAGHKDIAYLKKVIEAEKITLVHFVPMLESFLAEVGEGGMQDTSGGCYAAGKR